MYSKTKLPPHERLRKISYLLIAILHWMYIWLQSDALWEETWTAEKRLSIKIQHYPRYSLSHQTTSSLEPCKRKPQAMTGSFEHPHSCDPLPIFLVYAFLICHLSLKKTSLLLSNLCGLLLYVWIRNQEPENTWHSPCPPVTLSRVGEDWKGGGLRKY